MPAYVETVNTLLALGTIGLQLVVLLIVWNLLFARKGENTVLNFFYKYGFVIGFIVALSSLGLSLFYSEIVGYTACELCIIQRIFIYPQVLFLGLVMLLKKKNLFSNLSGLFAFLGMSVSIYHVYVENGGSSALGCATAEVGKITCAARYVYEFGYITIPVMALTAQVLLLLLWLNHRYIAKKRASQAVL